MARYRKAPICPKCGKAIKGKYWEPTVFFCGDTFTGWDYEGHVCKVGLKYMIERMDTHEWWDKEMSQFTRNPLQAFVWVKKEDAEHYLLHSTLIPPRILCQVTEHEFVKS